MKMYWDYKVVFGRNDTTQTTSINVWGATASSYEEIHNYVMCQVYVEIASHAKYGVDAFIKSVTIERQ
jgi:hypothetical protein